MPRTLKRFFNDRHRHGGTKFWIYPQPKSSKGRKGFKREIVHIDAAPGTIKAGPQDEYIWVIDAEGKEPYKHESTWKTQWRPPYPDTEPRNDPVKPKRGHFDHLKPATREFSAATVYATVRFVLDAWKHYFGRPLSWFFSDMDHPLEVIPRVNSHNSWSGQGYLEFGFPPLNLFDHDYKHPLCENFDAVAHETGHFLLKSIMGNPTDDKKTLEYRAYEEASADLVAIVASLHFDSVLCRLLKDTQGRLSSLNFASRIVEMGDREVRRAFTDETMSTVENARYTYDKYPLSLPFTGAAFDLLVAIYDYKLVDCDAIRAALADRSLRARLKQIRTPKDESQELKLELRQLKRRFGLYLTNHKQQFTAALRDARDEFARLMARTWDMTSVEGFSYSKALANMIAADEELNEGRYSRLIYRVFKARRISPGPPR